MNVKYKTILPKVSAFEYRVNKFFSEASARAIEHGLSASEVRGATMRWLIIEAPVTRILPNIGPRKESVRLLIDHEESFKFQVLDATLDSGQLSNAILEKYLNQMKLDSGYKLCPGVEQEYMATKIRLKHKPNVLREWARGMRYDHVDCELWYSPNEIRSKTSKTNKKTCGKCYTLILSMRKSAKNAQKTQTRPRKTPPKATNLRYLTPKSRRRTLRKKSAKVKKLSKKLEKYENYMCNLDSEQSSEMNAIVQKISGNFSSDLGQLFNEHEKGDILKRIWENDIQQNKKDFFKDQGKNVNAQTGSRYSIITYRVALAVFSRSPAAYEALKTFNILQLPSVSTLKTYMRSNREEPGPIYHRLADEKKKYDEIKSFKKKMGMSVPLGEGALMFDEVKVSASIYWNAKSNKFIGHALTPEDMSSLHDVYKEIESSDKIRKASYILQFLWRDITSNYDIIGPYYTSENGLDHQFIMACVLETIHLFSLYQFDVTLLICDGASANLKLLKLLCGAEPKVYPVTDGTDRYRVKTCFQNIYSKNNIHVIICPSHQLKNMVAALYSSRENGTKYFLLENSGLGWKSVTDMYKRELNRAENNEIRRIPDMLSSYIYRDKWTRLNVKAAKIMQQPHVLAEMKEHLSTNDNDSHLCNTIQYLEACNKLFENGFLSHHKITLRDRSVIESLDEGFWFFIGWCDDAILNNVVIERNDQKQFLSWQTWDLMRLTYYGFKDFVDSFFTRHATDHHYIIPVRLNGSAVETLFSQLKYSAGGHLSSTNYASARSSLLVKRQVRGHNVKDKEYRNIELNISSQPLKRKKTS